MMGVRASVAVVSMTSAPLTATGIPTARIDNVADYKTFQGVATTTAGAGAATVNIEGSLDTVHFDVVGTLSLTASTTGGSDSFTSTDRYRQYRVNVTAISGTGCGVVVQMAY